MSEVENAIRVIANALTEDVEYRKIWEDNISMHIQDEYHRFNLIEYRTKAKPMADRAAKNFVDILARYAKHE